MMCSNTLAIILQLVGALMFISIGVFFIKTRNGTIRLGIIFLMFSLAFVGIGHVFCPFPTADANHIIVSTPVLASLVYIFITHFNRKKSKKGKK